MLHILDGVMNYLFVNNVIESSFYHIISLFFTYILVHDIIPHKKFRIAITLACLAGNVWLHFICCAFVRLRCCKLAIVLIFLFDVNMLFVFGRPERSTSILDLRLECQDLEKFSVINRFARFHGRGQTDNAETSTDATAAMQKPCAQKYVTAVPMPRSLPDRVQCLSL